MNVSNVKAFVWTLPNPELLSERDEHDHSNCIFTKQLDNDEAEIITKTFDNRRGDFYAYQKRMEEKKRIFEELEKEIKPNTSIEYIYFCVTDRDCYDMRKEVSRSNKSVIERGIDTWMKKTNTPMDIWKDISGGTQLPHVLKIKLTDALTKRPGYLYIFDLLHPRFLSPTLETKRGSVIYSSFQAIRHLVDLVISTNNTYDIHTAYNNEVWSSLLVPFLCGFGKLLVLGYLNECPKKHKVETLMALDFIAKMRCIKSKSLPNNAILKVFDTETIADNERKYKESQVTIQEMKTYVDEILVEKSARETYIEQSWSVNQ
ncbi:hypothetical protein MFLAVUS_009129 [Mucor flavus]|uniref:Uncharacterized protein n=1 Tax=Mucor flavus TaxID=439312 RepID=A0ABP9Z915_9FUNG